MSTRAVYDELRGICEAALGPNIVVTDSIAATAAALNAGSAVVCILRPALTYHTWDEVTATWTLWALVGQVATDEDATPAAWVDLDAILDALALPLALGTAEPFNFTGSQGQAWPGYVLTTTSLIPKEQ